MNIGLVLLGAAMVLVVVRIVRGPTLADRVVGLDMITLLGISAIGLFAIKTDLSLYVDIAVALGLVSFLSTVAFARYILAQGQK
ncbi:MAG: monovalent cation/H+ antiporter complex subunit F [Devosia sp.]